MIQKLNEPVSVSMTYDCKKRHATPRSIIWHERLYPVTKIGFHHTVREGRNLFHVFSVTTPTLFFKLVLDAENLHWKVEEIADGNAS